MRSPQSTLLHSTRHTRSAARGAAQHAAQHTHLYTHMYTQVQYQEVFERLARDKRGKLHAGMSFSEIISVAWRIHAACGVGKTALALYIASKVLPDRGQKHLYVAHTPAGVDHFMRQAVAHTVVLAKHGVDVAVDVSSGVDVAPAWIHAISKTQFHRFVAANPGYTPEIVYIDEADLQSTDASRWVTYDPVSPPKGMSKEDAVAHNADVELAKASTKPYHKTRRILTEYCAEKANAVVLLTATPNWDDVPDIDLGRVLSRELQYASTPALSVRVHEVDQGATTMATQQNLIRAGCILALDRLPAARAGDGVMMIKCRDTKVCVTLAKLLNGERAGSARVFVHDNSSVDTELVWDHVAGAATGNHGTSVQFVTTVYIGARAYDHHGICSTMHVGDSDVERVPCQLVGRADRWRGDHVDFIHVTADVRRCARTMARLVDVAYSGCVTDLADLDDDVITFDTVETRRTTRNGGGDKKRPGEDKAIGGALLVDTVFQLEFGRACKKLIKSQLARLRPGGGNGDGGRKGKKKEEEKEKEEEKKEKKEEEKEFWMSHEPSDVEGALAVLAHYPTLYYKGDKCARSGTLAKFAHNVHKNMNNKSYGPAYYAKWAPVRAANNRRRKQLYDTGISKVISIANLCGLGALKSANNIRIHQAWIDAFGLDQPPREKRTDKANKLTGGFARHPYENVIARSKDYRTKPSSKSYDATFCRVWGKTNDTVAAVPVGVKVVTHMESTNTPPRSAVSREETRLYNCYRDACTKTTADSYFAGRLHVLESPQALRVHVNHCTDGKQCLLCRGCAMLIADCPGAHDIKSKGTTPEANARWSAFKYCVSEHKRLELLEAERAARAAWNLAHEKKKASTKKRASTKKKKKKAANAPVKTPGKAPGKKKKKKKGEKKGTKRKRATANTTPAAIASAVPVPALAPGPAPM